MDKNESTRIFTSNQLINTTVQTIFTENSRLEIAILIRIGIYFSGFEFGLTFVRWRAEYEFINFNVAPQAAGNIKV